MQLLHRILINSSLIAALTTFAAAQDKHQIAAPVIGDAVSDIDKSIWYVFQDRKNNYWFGSDGQGLYRYDGRTLTHFTKKDGLCDNRIRGIQEDKSGNILINMMVGIGISKFDGQKFITLPAMESCAIDQGWHLQSDDLWFAGPQDSGTVFRYDGKSLYRLHMPKTKAGEEHIAKFPRSKFPNMTYSPYDVYSIFKDSRGVLWIGTNLGVCRYDGQSFAWISEDELEFDQQGQAFNVRSIIEDKEGKLWFSNTMHRYDAHLNASAGQFSYKKEQGIDNGTHDDDYFMSAVQDRNGELWMATLHSGVWRYDGKNMTHYPVKDGAKDTTLFSIYKDNRGDLWLGTLEAGAYKFNGTTFEKFRP